jgi:hypothetical protein
MSDIPIGNTKNWTLMFPSGKSTTLRRIQGMVIEGKHYPTQWFVDNGNKSRKIYPKSFLALSAIGVSLLYYSKLCEAREDKWELSRNHEKELEDQYDSGRKQGNWDITHDKMTPEQFMQIYGYNCEC